MGGIGTNEEVMKRMLFLFFVQLAFTSCEEDVNKCSFYFAPRGFVLNESMVDSSVSSVAFSHRYAGGNVSFTGEGHSYHFNTGRVHIDKYLFEVPVGAYLVEFFIDTASLYGQSGGSFNALPHEIVLTDSTDKVIIDIEQTCSLFLVRDGDAVLPDPPSIIQRYTYSEEYYISYPLTFDDTTGLYYAYFAPDPRPDNPTAYLWFYGDRPGIERGGLSTVDLDFGTIYRIDIYGK